jgi:hypothetical protein
MRASPAILGLLTIAIIAGGAHALVYGGGVASSMLKGRVLVTAFLGGWALAFTRPLLLLMVPLTTVIWLRTGRQGASRPQSPGLSPALFLIGFSLTFVVAISGAPDMIARAIYRAHKLLEIGVGALLVLWGALVAVRVPALIDARPGWWAGALGGAAGLLFYHELDPSYDSVFFATGNAIASSHAPLTVAAFATALSVLYLVVAVQVGRWRLPVGRALGGAATAVIGVAVAGGWLEMVRAILVR